VQLGAGTNLKSLCFIDNLLAALAHAWFERNQQDRVEIFNCVDKPDLDSRTIANTIAGFCGQTGYMQLPYCMGWALAVPFDVAGRITGKDFGVSTARIHKLAKSQTLFGADKLRRSGYSQPVSLVDGLRQTTEWYLSTGRRETTVRHIPPRQE
jgi:nucleoside-diphosphate-sugar epimerase